MAGPSDVRRRGDDHEHQGPRDERGVPLGMLSVQQDDAMPIVADAPAPPGTGGGLRALLRENLFKDARNSLMTVVFGGIIVYLAVRAMGFVLFNRKVMPDGTVRSGWEVISDGPLLVYMVGNRFSQTGVSLTEVWISVWLVALAFGLAMGIGARADAPPMRLRTRLGITVPPFLGIAAILSQTRTILPTVLTVVAVALIPGGRELAVRLPDVLRRRSGVLLFGLMLVAFLVMTGFEPSNVNEFGGLLLTMTVSFAGILLSFPIGVLMALARRSSFPLIRPIAVTYIELIRGVPLISLLFIGEFALRFLFPPGTAVPGSIPRAIIMVTLFSGAYVAEVVRGGLQSVPAGQTEAGQAIGLSPLLITGRIVLPQALRNSIPALIGQFISLLKDTSLLIIIGLRDLLGVTDPVLATSRFVNQGFTAEAFVFVGFVFWVICFSMSRASQRLETRLGVGVR